MDILGFLGSAAGGSIVGPVLSFVTKFAHAKWIRPAEVKAEIDLLTAQRNAATEKAAWDAFAESHKSQSGLQAIPQGVSPFIANFYVLAEAATKSVRPALTFCGMPLAAWVYWTLASATATPAQIEMAKEINFMVFMMWSWWFGERYVAKGRQPISLIPGGSK